MKKVQERFEQAIRCNDNEWLDKFIALEPDTRQIDLLTIAAKYGHYDIYQSLISICCADPQSIDMTKLVRQCLLNQKCEMAKFLLEHGARISKDGPDNIGVRIRELGMADLIIQSADPNSCPNL